MASVNLHKNEIDILDLWDQKDFQTKISKKNGKTFRFMDGPPFVSGSLHTGSLGVGFIKDTVLRYRRMQGDLCNNKIGFDCHGLPSENMVMKLLNLTSNKDIEKYGVDKFIEECIITIQSLSLSWKPSYDKIGRIVNFNDQYKTLDAPFMETVWWIFKQIYEKKLIYKAFKVMPYSWACETPLSNFEAGQNYKDITTESLYVKFKSSNMDNTYFVAWTTTPWTLPSNNCLIVNPNMLYVKCICDNGEILIISQNSTNNLKIQFKSIEIFSLGKDMKGLEYEPLYDFLPFKYYKILVDDYVQDSKDIGTSIVHSSFAHGQDDCRVGLENNVISQKDLDQTCIVDNQGKFISGTSFLENRLVFETNKDITKDLKNRNMIVKTQTYVHSYPHCYRTDTKLIYKITSSYFVAVSQITDQLTEMNDKINWVNPDIGTKRFKNWIENANDWCISRNRYFGTPIPVWESDDGDKIVIGSIQELVDIARLDYTPIDLHLHNVKNIVITKNNKSYKLSGHTLDCWFESGSVPYGQYHYPFENSNIYDNEDYLCDFIAEGLDQTRGWFYTLLVISTIISNKPPFKNVICSGLVLGSDGMKESKRNKNFVDPGIRIKKFGADAIRLYIVSSPLVTGEPVKFLDQNVIDMNNELIHYLNVVTFYLEQIENINIKKKNINIKYITNISDYLNTTDLWILKKLHDIKNKVKHNMDMFKLDVATNDIISFINDMSNWYLKLNRDRTKGKHDDNQHEISLSVLFTVLYDFTVIFAPFAPFTTEYVYQKICNSSDYPSVHLCNYPSTNRDWTNVEIFDNLRDIVDTVRQIRGTTKSHMALRVPIKQCSIYHPDKNVLDNAAKLISIVYDEINSLNYEYKEITNDMMILKPKIHWKKIGQTFKKNANNVKNIIESFNQAQLQSLNDGNTIVIEDYPITTQYVDIETTLNQPENDNIKTYSKNNFTIRLDLTIDKEVEDVTNIKNIIALIQQSRKELKLKQWNKLLITFYDPSNIITQYEQYLEDKLGTYIEISPNELSNTYKEYICHNSNQKIAFNILLIDDQ